MVGKRGVKSVVGAFQSTAGTRQFWRILAAISGYCECTPNERVALRASAMWAASVSFSTGTTHTSGPKKALEA